MLEMIREFNLDKPAYNSSIVKNIGRGEFSGEEEHSTILYQSDKSSKMHTFHLAEGPGGFIEAICNKRNNPEDEYYGMTIIFDETDDNVPAWHKTSHFLSQHPNVTIEYGADKTGNLLHIENFEYCVEKYGGKMDLVTADGGFDFSKDFNRQEISIFNLLWGQTCYALCLQKLGGNFVLKIFDIFYEQTVHILYILSSFYEDVNVCKLKTSRIGNSEKYIVCRKFRFSSYLEFYPTIHKSFSKIKQSSGMSSDSWKYFQENIQKIDIFAKEPHFTRSNMDNNELYAWQLLNCEVPRYFTKQIEDINATFGQQQIENIHYTISLIDKQPKQDKLDQLVKQNVTKCVNWCIEHGIAYNNLTTTNIFEAIPLTRQTDIHCDPCGRNSLPALGAVGDSRSGGAKHPNTPWSVTENRG
jgi:23S rRNA U2552 (ribose-2'-O)-methylase RlmE/FtsJ